MERYARQAAIDGWDQDRLSEATIAIAGTGYTAFMASLQATAMGFGRLVLVGGPKTASAGDSTTGLAALVQSPNDDWAGFFAQVNPQVRIYPIRRACTERLIRKLPRLSGLVIAGNDPQAVVAGRRIAADGEVAVAAGGAAGTVGLWGSPEVDNLTHTLARYPESPLMAQITAALLIEEIRKELLPLAHEAGRSGGRQVVALSRLATATTNGRERPFRLQTDKIHMVGAGALGTWFGIGLGLAGARAQLNIFDGDQVEETNLNRQVLFAGAVGRPKATVLADRLQTLFPSLRPNGYGTRVAADTEEMMAAAGVTAACPDSFQVRAFLASAALRRRQPLINGGTSAVGGSCSTYIPGHTSCLSCLMDIERLALQEMAPTACGRQVESSVVTSNAATGALMAWTFKEMRSGRVHPGVWEYDGRPRHERIGVHSVRPACACHLN